MTREKDWNEGKHDKIYDESCT